MTHTLHVLTVQPRLPHVLLDAILTGVELALLEVGATRIWIDRARGDGLAVMAEVPDAAVDPEPATPGS